MPSLATFFDGIITPGGSNLPAPDAITGECLHEDGGKDAIFEIVEKVLSLFILILLSFFIYLPRFLFAR